VGRIRLRLEADPDVDLNDVDVRESVLESIRAQLDEEAGADLQKAQTHTHGSGPRKLPHRYPQALIERTTKTSRKLMQSMVEEITTVLAK